MLTRQIEIHQRTYVHTPTEKLLDVFINILSGGGGIVEINTRIRPDGPSEGHFPVVQLGFGRRMCAEQLRVAVLEAIDRKSNAGCVRC